MKTLKDLEAQAKAMLDALDEDQREDFLFHSFDKSVERITSDLETSLLETERLYTELGLSKDALPAPILAHLLSLIFSLSIDKTGSQRAVFVMMSELPFVDLTIADPNRKTH